MWNFFLSPSKLVLVACPTFCICQLHDKYQNYKYEKQEIFWSGLPSTSKLRVFSQLHPEAIWPLSSLQNQLILPEKDCPYVWHDIYISVSNDNHPKTISENLPKCGSQTGLSRSWRKLESSFWSWLSPSSRFRWIDNNKEFRFGQAMPKFELYFAQNFIWKFQPWPNLRLTYLALRRRLPSSLFNSRWSKYWQKALPLKYCQKYSH